MLPIAIASASIADLWTHDKKIRKFNFEPQVEMHILCLHGSGASGDIMKSQMGRFELSVLISKPKFVLFKVRGS